MNILSAMILSAGLGAVLMPLYRGWFSRSIEEQVLTFREAADNETGLLLPGMAASGVTGILWAAETGHNLFTEGWLVTMLILWVVSTFVLLPIMGIGLRRARLFALQSAKTGIVSDELQQAISDKVPIVFGTAIAVLVIVMVWLRVFQPY
jgi:uncharacterized membrane protein